MNSPLVSVIVTTKNSARTIGRCLKCISQQLYSNIEIIVVDNLSMDGTAKIATRYPKVRFYLQGPERSAQRNYGIKCARGKYILYLDSDQYIHKNTIYECVRMMDLGFDCISIPELNWPFNLLNRSINYEKKFTSYQRDKALPRFFDKKVFKIMGNFNEKRTFDEDVELYVRLQKEGFLEGKIFLPILHDEATSVWNIIKKYYYYGSISNLNKEMPYNDEISKYYGFDLQFIKNLVIYSFKNPWMFCCGIFIKIAKYSAFAFGMYSQYTNEQIFGNK